MLIIFDTAAAVTEATNAVITVDDGRRVCIEATGLAGIETVSLYQKARSGWAQCYEDGVDIKLTVTGNSLHVVGPKRILCIKPVTVSPVEVKISNYLGS